MPLERHGTVLPVNSIILNHMTEDFICDFLCSPVQLRIMPCSYVIFAHKINETGRKRNKRIKSRIYHTVSEEWMRNPAAALSWNPLSDQISGIFAVLKNACIHVINKVHKNLTIKKINPFRSGQIRGRR